MWEMATSETDLKKQKQRHLHGKEGEKTREMILKKIKNNNNNKTKQNKNI